MGFKDLFLFNKALLAKQVWCILTSPNCLLAKVFKARYFPFSDILSAKVDSYPSFTWRSICSARDVIRDGLVWRVGNGTHINLWNDPWLPGKENNRIKGHDIGTSWITVDQLIEGSTWNRELIHKLVDSETANRILTIPISDSRPEDIRVWKFEGTGEYTVKSDYRAIVTELLQNKPNLSPKTEEYRRFYQGLWKLDIPAKIKIYMWRLFHNLVPHYENLARRTLCEEAVCPLCKTELETSDHLLWACVILQDIWDALKV